MRIQRFKNFCPLPACCTRRIYIIVRFEFGTRVKGMNEHLSQRGFEPVYVDKISGLIVTASIVFSIVTFNRTWAKCGMGKRMLPKSRLFGSKQNSCLL